MNDKNNQIDVKNVTGAVRSHRPTDDGHIYVRAQKGQWQRLRKLMGWFFMLLFVVGPWLTWNNRQAILLDVEQQRFHIFGSTIWPQDLTLLALLFVVAAFGLFFITTFLGRVWCGYLCPQTVWTFLFIWFEEKFEGSANKRRQLDKSSWNFNKLWRKSAKHAAWLAVSLFTGFTFIAYFVPAVELGLGLLTFSASFWPVFWVLFFAFCTYGNAGWMRTIMCTHMCPYSRFQSAMFDKDTYTVSYDVERGEQRGPRPRKKDPKELGLGDCIDCDMCVQVCPAGIDIRDGLQYECINCGACVDACDQTMERMGYENGLISYTTEHKLRHKETHVARPKLIGYGVVMVIMLAAFVYMAANIMPLGVEVIRDRNQLYRETAEGLVENTYTLKIINKTLEAETYQLKVDGVDELEWIGPTEVTVSGGEVFTLPISLSADPYLLSSPVQDITFVVTRAGAAPDERKSGARNESKFFGSAR
ncbi:cytochrome c oxidase accessory protein CcoG [Zobellella endophytica]|uniref:Cytochrome c oxidase accessory protein CcoG n=1 Tax=Zobellella endophytica TaxID=2116700 RepID=A0A2P7R4H0_9GAMM|nr:cytochrome c oxidase accessory protein CcoG [Zobellella endophytica]PSJ45114.1 cytochrome c oxidase accessory protein CcoG [Zobellella endophytica]